jgi:hypothetical protein
MSEDVLGQRPLRSGASPDRAAGVDSASQQSSGAQAADQAAARAAVDRINAADVGTAQRETTEVGAGVTVDQQQELLHDKGHSVTLASGTRLECQVDEGGFTLSATPGIVVSGAGETLHVTSVRYDFATASFTTAASVRVDVPFLHLYAKLAEHKINAALNDKLKPLLPPNVAKAGYDPKTDPNLPATIQALSAHFPTTGGGSSLSDATLHHTLVIQEEIRAPLGVDNLELYIKPQTSIFLELSTVGDVHHPKLKSAGLSSGDGIVLRKAGGRSAQEISIKEVEITPGGHFRFDYDLLPEHLLGLFSAFGAIATSHTSEEAALRLQHVKSPRLDAVRAMVDEKLQAAAPPKFHELLTKYDHVVPGYSLLDLFH